MYTEEQTAEDMQFLKEQNEFIIQLVKDNNSVGLLGMIATATLNSQITLGIIVRLLEDKNGS